MTEKTPDERRPRLNEDEPDVEGHLMRQGPDLVKMGPEDVAAESERRQGLGEGDEGDDGEARRPR